MNRRPKDGEGMPWRRQKCAERRTGKVESGSEGWQWRRDEGNEREIEGEMKGDNKSDEEEIGCRGRMRGITRMTGR